MAIDAADLDRRARLVVKNAVAVRVLAEMAIDALHTFFEMNVVQVNRLLEPIRIVRRNDPVLRIEQVPFAIALENFAKQPAVPVKIGELRALQLGIEFRRAGLV